MPKSLVPEVRRTTAVTTAGKARRTKSAGTRATGAAGEPECLTPDADTLRAMIAEAAYFRAQRRGFEAGHEVEDWLAAEAEIVSGVGSLEKVADGPH